VSEGLTRRPEGIQQDDGDELGGREERRRVDEVRCGLCGGGKIGLLFYKLRGCGVGPGHWQVGPSGLVF
jgi:hypothetical protein